MVNYENRLCQNYIGIVFLLLLYLLAEQNTLKDKRTLQEEKRTTASYSYLVYYLYTIHEDISVKQTGQC